MLRTSAHRTLSSTTRTLLLIPGITSATTPLQMSTSTSTKPKQEPRIIKSEDAEAEGMKWVKLRKIHWEDQEGRKVSRDRYSSRTTLWNGESDCYHAINFVFASNLTSYRESGKPPTVPLAKGRLTASTLPLLRLPFLSTFSRLTCIFGFPPRLIAVAIIALISHPSKPLSTVIIEQYRPPIGKYIIGMFQYHENE